MSLFIESAQRAARRRDVVAGWNRDAGARHADDGLDLDEAPGYEAASGPARAPRGDGAAVAALTDTAPAASETYSTAQEAYRDALAYDKQRSRSRKRWAVARIAMIAVLTPLALVLLFLAAYATTCIVNGATPEELVELMGQLFERMAVFAGQVLGRAVS